MARLDPQKAHQILFRAIAKLPDSLAHWKLMIVGTGPEEMRLLKLGEQLGITHRLEWLGQVPDPYSFYSSADIMVLPSLYEGTPNAVIEALYSGLPVITSDASPGPLELIRHEKNGLVFPSGNIGLLCAAMTKLAEDAALRAQLGAAARDSVRQFELPYSLADWDAAAGWNNPVTHS